MSLSCVDANEDFASYRIASIKRADVLIVCYASDKMSSLEEVEKTWLSERTQVENCSPFVLVGTRQDLSSSSPNSVSLKVARKIGNKYGAHDVLECSSHWYNTGSEEKHNVQAVFDAAIKCYLKVNNYPQKNKNTCLCVII